MIIFYIKENITATLIWEIKVKHYYHRVLEVKIDLIARILFFLSVSATFFEFPLVLLAFCKTTPSCE